MSVCKLLCISCVAYAIASGGACAADPGAPGDAGRLKAEAARAFAERLAPAGSEVYVRAFRQALGLADSVQSPPPAAGARLIADRSVRRGDLDADDRYRQNLTQMVSDAVPKIWHGEDVPQGAYPEVVAITGNNGLCTGTLIAPDVVLTAAHCYHAGVREQVVLGDNMLKPVQQVAVRSAKAMIEQTAPLRAGDVALLFLEQPLKTRPVRLASTAEIDGFGRAVVVGYGETENAAAKPLGVKRHVELPVASPHCNGYVKSSAGPVPDETYYGCAPGSEIVAGMPRLDRDTCHGDSGGPIFARDAAGQYVLAGVTSRAVVRPGLAACGDGGIYTRVDGPALAWIKASVPVAALESPRVAALAAPSAVAPTPVAPSAAFSDEANARKAEQRLAEFLGRLHENGTNVEGVLVEKDATSLALRVRDAPSLLIPVVNSGVAAERFTGLPGIFKVRRDGGGVRIARADFKVVTDLLDVAKALQPRQAAVSAGIRNVATLLAELSKGNATSAEFLELSRLTEDQLIRKYKELKPEQALERKAIVSAYAAIRDTNKAYYSDHEQRYKPVIYDRMYRNSKGVVGLRLRHDTKVFCSGVLLGEGIVLTANHCLSRGNPKEVEVAVNYELDFGGALPPLEVYPVDEVIAQGDGLLDYAVLRLAAGGAQRLPGMSLASMRQCIDLGRVRMEDAIYVIGHPLDSPKLIADLGYVQFPYQVSEQELYRLMMKNEAKLAAAGSAGEGDVAKVLREIRDSYQAGNDQYGSWYYNRSLRWSGMPTIGALVDTFEGNSGSPAYLRSRNYVIGILVKGQRDLNTRHEGGWQRHEAILPINEIVADVDRKKPGWRKQNHVCDSQQGA